MVPRPADSVFSTVVLASHSWFRDTELRRCGKKPRRVKKPRAVSLASAMSVVAPTLSDADIENLAAYYAAIEISVGKLPGP